MWIGLKWVAIKNIRFLKNVERSRPVFPKPGPYIRNKGNRNNDFFKCIPCFNFGLLWAWCFENITLENILQSSYPDEEI